MFIIFEGIHDVGKTTIINSFISKNIDYKVFSGKRSIPEFADYNNYDISNFAFGANISILWFANFAQNINVIFDRLHVSEFAYSQTIRNMKEEESINRFSVIDERLAKQEVRLVYLTCNADVLKHRMKDRNKNFDPNQISQLISKLDKAYELSKITKIKIDTNKDIQSITSEVISFLN